METTNQNENSATVNVELSLKSQAQLRNLDGLKRGFKTTVGYRTQEEWAKREDEPEICFFLGFKEIPNDEGEAVRCAILQNRMEVFLSAQKVLIDALSPLEAGTPVEIVYQGKKKNKSTAGSTNLFEVFVLTQEGGEE